MLNATNLQGRLTADVELKHTQSDIAVTSFTIAIDNPAAKGAEKTSSFIDCVAWRGTAEMISKYFSKGSQIIVEGHLQSRMWEDKESKKRKSTEIVVERVHFCGNKSDKPNNTGNIDEIEQNARNAGVTVSNEFVEIDGDDDLPF